MATGSEDDSGDLGAAVDGFQRGQEAELWVEGIGQGRPVDSEFCRRPRGTMRMVARRKNVGTMAKAWYL